MYIVDFAHKYAHCREKNNNFIFFPKYLVLRLFYIHKMYISYNFSNTDKYENNCNVYLIFLAVCVILNTIYYI